MATRKKAAEKPAISDERLAEIRADAHSKTNWANVQPVAPACVCGAFLPGSTVTSWGWTLPKGWCHRHGVVQHSRNAH